MTAAVSIFFFGSALGLLLIGMQFARTGRRTLSYFAWGLEAAGLALALWGVARLIDPSDPDHLEIWVSIGVLFLVVALVAILLSWTHSLAERTRNLVWVTAGALIVLLAMLRFANPSAAEITDAGLLVFNPHGSVAVLEIALMALAVLPAIPVVASELRATSGHIFRVFMTTVVVGGFVLIISADKIALIMAGDTLFVAVIVMAVTFARNPEHWLAAATEG